jgi:hypothetical protein
LYTYTKGAQMRQFSKSRRRLAAGAFLIVAAPVALGSVAYACQSLSTLHANPGTSPAGGSITLYGKNYSSAATSSVISIRLDTRDGRVIGTFSPRSILDNVTVTVPGDVAVGQHTLLATQTTAAGNAVSGSPGRTTLSVTAARTSTQGSAASAAAATSSEPVAATPAAAAPAAPAAVSSAPAIATAAAAGTSAARIDAPVAPAASPAAAPTAAVATESVATNVVAAPAAPAAPAAAEAAQVTVGGLLPASSSSNSILPGLTLGAGLALVLLSLGAFIKSSRNVRSDAPLAG